MDGRARSAGRNAVGPDMSRVPASFHLASGCRRVPVRGDGDALARVVLAGSLSRVPLSLERGGDSWHDSAEAQAVYLSAARCAAGQRWRAVSDFLTNLALRAAGVLSVASPEIPAAPWSEPAEAGLEVKESVEEEPTPRSPATESREDGSRSDTRQPSAGERADVRPPSEIRGGPQKAEVPLRPAPAAPERIREVQTEHHEIVREAAPAPTIEVHETIREKEIVRETLVQRELNV